MRSLWLVLLGLGFTATHAVDAANLQAAVVSALEQAFDELGLGPSAKSGVRKLFEQEVLSDPMLFVTGYSSTHEGTDVQVDRNKLKGYLRFSEALFGAPALCVTTRAESGCGPCEAQREKFHGSLLNRFEKRGFLVKTGPKIAEGAAIADEAALDYVVARAAEARCDGVVYSEISLDPNDDSHDEAAASRVRVGSFLWLKDKSGRKLKARGLPASFASDDPKGALGAALKQVTEMFAGAASAVSAAAVDQASDERLVRLEGVSNFAVYARFKQAVASVLPELRFEERIMSPGRVTFAAIGDAALLAPAKLVEALKRLPAEVSRGHANEIVVMLK